MANLTEITLCYDYIMELNASSESKKNRKKESNVKRWSLLCSYLFKIP